MILLTGSAGFIGRHVSAALGDIPHIGVDPRDPHAPALSAALKLDISAVIHLGAISDTMCNDCAALQQHNIDLPAFLAGFCRGRGIPFVYASSASVYGNGDGPLNAYAFSKLAHDAWIEEKRPENPWYGLRFFNVYGADEGHKRTQASLVWQMKHAGLRRIFEPFTQRDFIHVSDVVAAILWFLEALPDSGIYDVGTGQPRTVMDVALITRGMDFDIVLMPKELKGRYQRSTKADLAKLRAAGFGRKFLTLEEGVKLT